MTRPSEVPGNHVGAQSSVNEGESPFEVMNLTAAAASSECQTALTEGPAAARAALAKHRASIPPELARALETVGSYTINEVSFTVTPSLPPPFEPFASSNAIVHHEPFKCDFAINNVQS
jgi:hypothetical protein